MLHRAQITERAPAVLRDDPLGVAVRPDPDHASVVAHEMPTASGRLDGDDLLLRLSLRLPRHLDVQDAVGEVRFDLVGGDVVRQAKRAEEGTVAALGDLGVLVLTLLLALLLAADRQNAFG